MPATEEFDCVVIGGGITGLACAHALARRRVRTLLLEQFELHHSRGSSGGDSRTFRTYAAPDRMELWRTAKPLWEELAHEANCELLRQVGLLAYGNDLSSEIASLREHAVPVEELDARRARERFGVRLPKNGDIYLDRTSGYILADAARRAYVAVMEQQSAATIRPNTRVRGIATAESSVEITTDRLERIVAAAAVVAAGPWTAEFLEPLGIALPLQITRQTVAYYDAPADHYPVTIDYSTAGDLTGQGIYALPSPSHGLKVAAHHGGTLLSSPGPGDPDPRILSILNDWVSERFVGIQPEPTRTETCLYTIEAQQRFLVFREGRIIVASACNGEGFKFAPATAQQVAELARPLL